MNPARAFPGRFFKLERGPYPPAAVGKLDCSPLQGRLFFPAGAFDCPSRPGVDGDGQRALRPICVCVDGAICYPTPIVGPTMPELLGQTPSICSTTHRRQYNDPASLLDGKHAFRATRYSSDCSDGVCSAIDAATVAGFRASGNTARWRTPLKPGRDAGGFDGSRFDTALWRRAPLAVLRGLRPGAAYPGRSPRLAIPLLLTGSKQFRPGGRAGREGADLHSGQGSSQLQ